MKFGATMLLISFIAIGVFGFLAMGSVDEGAHRGCIAATAANATCPSERKGVPYIAFHMSALRKFSSATVENSSFAALTLVSILFVLLATILPSFLSSVLLRTYHTQSPAPLRIPQKLSRWISRHEKCDLLLAA